MTKQQANSFPVMEKNINIHLEIIWNMISIFAETDLSFAYVSRLKNLIENIDNETAFIKRILNEHGF